MKIQVGAGTYEVEDSFANLSPEEQDKTIHEITQAEQVHSEVKQEKTKKEEVANAPVSPWDVTNAQSGIRQYAIDPTIQAAGVIPNLLSHPLVQHGLELAAGAGVAKKVGGALLDKYLQAQQALQTPTTPSATPTPSVSTAPVGTAPTVTTPNAAMASSTPPSGTIPLGETAPGIPQSNPGQQLVDWVKQGGQQKGLPNPVTGAVPPSATPPAAESPGMMSRSAQLFRQYGPALGKAGIGGAALFHSGGLNTNEDEELRKRRAIQQLNTNANNAISSGFANQLNTLSK